MKKSRNKKINRIKQIIISNIFIYKAKLFDFKSFKLLKNPNLHYKVKNDNLKYIFLFEKWFEEIFGYKIKQFIL